MRLCFALLLQMAVKFIQRITDGLLQTLAHNLIEEATGKPDLDHSTVALPKSDYLPDFLDPVCDDSLDQSKACFC